MSRSSLAVLALASLAAAGSPSLARAHEVVSEVDRSGGAVAVRVRYHDGPPLAGASYVVESPRGGEPFAQGRTDRHGWVAFAPDVAGRWTVRIADATGHGKTVEVDVADVAAPAPAPIAAAPPTVPVSLDPPRAASEGESRGGSTLRVLAAVTAIVVVFRLLLAVQRARRGKAR